MAILICKNVTRKKAMKILRTIFIQNTNDKNQPEMQSTKKNFFFVASFSFRNWKNSEQPQIKSMFNQFIWPVFLFAFAQSVE